jgi:electron transfer flavoprotein alpha subunit
MSAEVSSGIWVVGEQRQGKLKSATLELITEGRKIADSLKEELSVIIIGYNLKHLIDTLIDYGPDKVVTVDTEETQFFIPEVYADTLAFLAAQRKPSVILFPATYDGRDVAARLAAKLGVGLAADCTDLLVDEKGRFVQVRPAFGGNLMAVISQPSVRPQLATLRPGMVRPAKRQPKKPTSVESVKRESVRKYDKVVLKTVREVAEEAGNLDEAEVVIGVGRGIGSKENLRIVNHLSALLNAAIGGSRAIVDAGWLPQNQQIGLTGRAISPKMYIALGVSGSVQHLVGVRTAKQIVAINKDPEAPIFKVATLGIVGDLFDIVPALTRALETARPGVEVKEIHKSG